MDNRKDMGSEGMELVISSVSKLYRGNVWGLRGFSLSLEPGVLGLVGPNGAGKSSFNILWYLGPWPGILYPDSMERPRRRLWSGRRWPTSYSPLCPWARQ
jgi:ABC-type bacteriocin/lantibiotic exporter with double-glycine peptidase domain